MCYVWWCIAVHTECSFGTAHYFSYQRASSREKASLGVHEVYRFKSPCVLTQSHQGLCCLLEHCSVSSGSVNGHRQSWSECVNMQADLGLHCPCLAEGTFCMAQPDDPSAHISPCQLPCDILTILQFLADILKVKYKAKCFKFSALGFKWLII